MPFVDEEHRENPDPAIPGDRCYVYYESMMRKWRENPRWTTVDKIAAAIWPGDLKRACVLAFLVFFVIHVMEYEARKREENGDI
jgi:hypothetical protein